MNVRYTPGALRQIAQIIQTIAQDDWRAADRFSERLDDLAALLARNPDIGGLTLVRGLRAFPVKPYPYLVFYRHAKTGTGIEVIRVRHMARRQNWRTGR